MVLKKRIKMAKSLCANWKKSVYGLKQSGCNWNMLHEYLLDENFEQSLADPCMYNRITSELKVILTVWVMISLLQPAIYIYWVMSRVLCVANLKKKKDLGELPWFLGIEFKCVDGGIEMNQTKYLEKILSKCGMMDCKPRATPCDFGANKVTELMTLQS